jgi:hypothetical protein
MWLLARDDVERAWSRHIAQCHVDGALIVGSVTRLRLLMQRRSKHSAQVGALSRAD